MTAGRTLYRIVQLSDLHLTAKDEDQRSEPKLFGRLTGMNGAFRRLLASPGVHEADLLLVTGDVTDRGAPEAWRVFWDAVHGAKIRNVLVVPGNHDVCCLGARLPTGRDGYAQGDLKRAVDGLALGGASQTRFPWVERPEERIAVIGLNSNNLGNLTAITNAMGEIGFYQLSRLASKLHVIRDVPVKILALHHSPNIPAVEVERKRNIKPFSKLERLGHQIDPAQQMALQLLCITHRVRLVLHGHLHRTEIRRVGGIRIVGAPASTQPKAGPDGGQRLFFFRHTIAGETAKVRSEVMHLDA